MQLAQVDPVERDGAVRRVVEARDQLGEGRFTRAGRAHQRDRLARWQLQVEPRQDHPVSHVRKLDVVETHSPLRLQQIDRSRRVWHTRQLLEHARDLLESGRGRLVGVVEHRHLLRGSEKLPCVQQRREQHTYRELIPGNPQAADQQDDGERHVSDQHEPGVEDREQLDDAAVADAVALDERAELHPVALFLAEGLHRTDARHGLHELHDQLRRGRPGFAE